jgi:hypothetical protein
LERKLEALAERLCDGPAKLLGEVPDPRLLPTVVRAAHGTGNLLRTNPRRFFQDRPAGFYETVSVFFGPREEVRQRRRSFQAAQPVEKRVLLVLQGPLEPSRQ